MYNSCTHLLNVMLPYHERMLVVFLYKTINIKIPNDFLIRITQVTIEGYFPPKFVCFLNVKQLTLTTGTMIDIEFFSL